MLMTNLIFELYVKLPFPLPTQAGYLLFYSSPSRQFLDIKQWFSDQRQKRLKNGCPHKEEGEEASGADLIYCVGQSQVLILAIYVLCVFVCGLIAKLSPIT
jgi:hypothetical protein